jgi:adenine phosphoribosyltransferase
MNSSITIKSLKESIRNVPDFPKPGIQFKDITTALKDPETFQYIVDTISDHFKGKGITKVVAIESRGFIVGGAVAARLNAGFVPIRKPGKLPAAVFKKSYELEYGFDALEIHSDALLKDDIILIHDDLLATGGTSLAAIDLIKNFNIDKIFLSFIIELTFLNGREKLTHHEVHSLVQF